jgi:hypothetical protein
MSRPISTMLAAVVLLAACGGGNPAANDETATDATDATTTTAAPSQSDGAESLADFFGYGGDDPDAAQAQWQEQEAQIQEAIRVCMVELGFEYVPVLQPEGAFFYDDSGPEEYAARYGFGISTWVGNEDAFAGPADDWEDPNRAIVEAMSESERDAYYAALYGTEEEQQADMTVEVDPETGEEMYISEGFGFGCQGRAYEELYGSQSGQNALWEELGPDLEAMYERMQADPRIQEVNAEWSSCMADNGYEYESQETLYEDVFEVFQARLDEIVGPNGGYVDPFEGWTEDEINAFFEEKSEDEINAFFETANQQVDYDEEALAALQEEEIALAVAAAQCSKDFEDLYLEVSAEYEAEFIAGHRQQLEAIRDAQGG